MKPTTKCWISALVFFQCAAAPLSTDEEVPLETEAEFVSSVTPETSTCESKANETCDDPRCGKSVEQFVRWLREENPQKQWTDQLIATAHHEFDHLCEDNLQYAADCPVWAQTGECQESEASAFMLLNCGHSCGFCHLQNQEQRCKRADDQLPAVFPGDIERMFQRLITAEEFKKYSPTALSRDPWVVQLDDFLDEDEMAAFRHYGAANHWEKSTNTGAMKDDGSAQFESLRTSARTSSTAWCTYEPPCWQQSEIQRVLDRAENVTLIPRENSEFFQFLRYEPGEYYVSHHDFIPMHLQLPISARVYTMYFYLNDVAVGGQTRFDALGIEVRPKAGRVVVWQNVKSGDPTAKEWRTSHEALKPRSGVKYGVNLWLHLYNFQQPYRILCTG